MSAVGLDYGWELFKGWKLFCCIVMMIAKIMLLIKLEKYKIMIGVEWHAWR